MRATLRIDVLLLLTLSIYTSRAQDSLEIIPVVESTAAQDYSSEERNRQLDSLKTVLADSSLSDSALRIYPFNHGILTAADTIGRANSSSKAQTFVTPTYDQNVKKYTVATVPNPKKNGANGYVSDPAGYIQADEVNRLNQLVYSVEQKTSAQIAVVVLPSIGKEVPKNFAVKLFEKWGIGQADTDNGLLILTVMDQRRTEFEVGYGLEPILTDLVCFNIGSNAIVPNFKRSDYGEGLIASVNLIETYLTDPQAIEEIYSIGIDQQGQTEHSHGFWYYFLWIYGILSLVIAGVYYAISYDIERSKDDFYDKYKRLDGLKFLGFIILFPLPFIFFNRLVKDRLKRYRYAPRFSRKNGQKMRILNQWSENKFLDQAEIVEEKIKSILYDVWITDDESDVLILKYDGSNSRKYSKCTSCGYKTYGRKKSVVVRTATYHRSGYGFDHYQCKNCHFADKKRFTIPQKVKSSSSSSGSRSSFSSSSSSSSSFGGGSSGGGGAGVSW
ncbi:hypothetical protein GCM10009117_01870 [Gangjinia marincola]|uniref:TPM domain-containing protein n=1 Tax=Gangjinia marincola TaxID=578463 RepID=A0ABN1MD66_9FLAO